MISLSPEEFNEFLAYMGQRVLWRRAFACPCVLVSTGAAVPGCPTCDGLGTVWDEGIDSVAAPTSVKRRMEWAEFGRWENGDTVLSLPSDQPIYQLGEKDRVIMLQSTEPFSVVVPWGKRVRGTVVSISRCLAIEGGTLTVIQRPNVVGGLLVWPVGQGPQEGTQVSITGRRRLEYYAVRELPQERAHHGGKDLPRLIHVRSWDLWGRGEQL